MDATVRKQQGFSLLELLMVCAVIGVIAAIAIPSLLNALERGKQKRTLADMRSLSTAMETYGIDHGGYPPQAVPGNFDATTLCIEPTYIASAPLHDAWGYVFNYSTAVGSTDYTLVSYGKDGVQSGPTAGATHNYNDDIVMVSGVLVVYPDGVQDD